MAKRTWEFEIEGRSHLVELQHGTFSGKRKVWLDSNEIISDQKLLDQGSQYRFKVDGHYGEIGVVTNGISFDFYLLVDGKPITAQNAKRRQSRMLKQTLTEKRFWYDLAENTGLEYSIPEENHGLPLYRLAGVMNGFLLAVNGAPMNRSSFNPYFYLTLTIRCAPHTDPKEAARQIKKDAKIKRVTRNAMMIRVEREYVWLRIAFQSKSETAASLAAKIGSTVQALSRHIKATETENCEGERCKARPYSNPGKLVLVNDVPYLLCETCNKDIPNIIDKAEQSSRNPASTVVLALLAGCIGILLGAVLFALIGVYLNVIAALTGVAVFFGILKLMNLAGAKTNAWITVLAGLESVASVILGVFFTIVLYVIKEYNAPVSIELFVFSALAMIEDPGILLESLLYSGIGILSYGWSVLRGQTGQMKPLTKPKIEEL